jgi:hypothetical protein
MVVGNSSIRRFRNLLSIVRLSVIGAKTATVNA